MKIWKVILATLVIFAAGALAGGLFVKSTLLATGTTAAPTNSVPNRFMQNHLLDRMKAELNLSPEQKQHIEKIFAESRARIDTLNSLIAPEVKMEFRAVQDSIRAELNPEQREKYEQMLKQRPPQSRRPKPPGDGSQTNRTNNFRKPSGQSSNTPPR